MTTQTTTTKWPRVDWAIQEDPSRFNPTPTPYQPCLVEERREGFLQADT